MSKNKNDPNVVCRCPKTKNDPNVVCRCPKTKMIQTLFADVQKQKRPKRCLQMSKNKNDPNVVCRCLNAFVYVML
jgi:hypothetical protein